MQKSCCGPAIAQRFQGTTATVITLSTDSSAIAVCIEVGARNPNDQVTYSDIDMKTDGLGGRYVHKDGSPY